MNRVSAVVLATLLLASAVGLAEGQRSRTFVVSDVARDGNDVSVSLRNVASFARIHFASLTDDGVLVASEFSGEAWSQGHVTLPFRLFRDARVVTLTISFERGNGEERETFAIEIPRPPADAGLYKVIVEDATTDGERARVTLRNAGNRTVASVVLSLEDLAGIKIGTPYFRTIERLAPGDSAVAEFGLVKDAADVAVALEYDNRTTTTKVRLRETEGASGGAPGRLGLKTDFPIREQEPGRSADYSVKVENPGRERLVELATRGLPEGYVARFFVGNAPAPSVRLAAGGSRDVVVSLSLPAGATKDVGRTLAFELVATSEGVETVLPLQVTVLGAGRLELEGENWFANLAPGETREVNVTVRNSGTAALRDVVLGASKPTGWRTAFDPPRLAKLDPGERREVTMRVSAPEDVGTGKYVLDVGASAGDVNARTRTLSLDVAAPPSSDLGWIAAAAVAAVVAVFVIVKAKRR
ncbi:MAG TPA: NEW3 domain-containing protein [Candidatus Thermoplasmatota archaeon]|nr:NEW3 domain-containing protein [Candidatus Thermoplasmatota archaeon]